MTQQYWDDLIYEGQKLTEAAEGIPRDLDAEIPDAAVGQAQIRRDAERYRASVGDRRPRNRNRPVDQLQDVIDAYRWNHPDASRAVRRGIGFSRPGR